MATLFTDINATQAKRLYEISGTDTRQATAFTYKDTEIIACYPATLTGAQVGHLVEVADKVVFWHYGYNKGCNRSVQVEIGNQCFMLDVTSDETLDRPEFID